MKDLLIGGFIALFSRRFVLYTFTFLIMFSISTLQFIFLEDNSTNSDDPLVYYIQIAIAISFIILGFTIAKQSLYLQVPIFLILTGGLTALFYFSTLYIAGYFAIIAFLVWLLITILSSFTFSRNLLGSKVLGSIIFLGKDPNERILFAGIFYVLFVVDLLLGGYLLVEELTSQETDLLSVIVASIICLSSLLVIFVVYFGGKRDDVFFSIIAVYFLIISVRIFSYSFEVITDSGSSLSIFSISLALFFLFYSVSGYGKKLRKIGPQSKSDDDDKDHEEAGIFWFEKLQDRIGDRGGILIVLGLVLGYHISILENYSISQNADSDAFLSAILSRTRIINEIAIISACSLFLVLILFYLFSPSFRRYASPKLIRLAFLPSFDQLLELVNKVRGDELSVKKLSGSLAWALAKGSVKGFFKKDSNIKEGVSSSGVEYLNSLLDENKDKKK